jgi:sterol desaturase/sphingolipid hydroxylase (fatty acid hydroxylase superfamily)
MTNAFTWIGPLISFAAILAFAGLERALPLRPLQEPPGRHDGRNLAFALVSFVVLFGLERPLIQPLAAWTAERGVGLTPRLPGPEWLRWAVAIVLLDYTIWVWHRLTHRVPWLWRFHRIHHADLDLTATTALRFHAGELVLSIPWRAAQVLLIGVAPGPLAVWRVLFFVSVLFHHANWRLPERVEAVLGRLVMTPRLHGIHHSVRDEEVNSNYSSGLILWDRLHRTLRRRPEGALVIGLPEVRDPAEARLARMLAAPFAERCARD